MGRLGRVLAAGVLLVAACGGDGADPTDTPPNDPATSAATTVPATAAPTTTAADPPATTAVPAPSTTGAPAGTGFEPIAIPVGPGGIEYRGSGDEQEILGPSLLAAGPDGAVHLYDPVGGRILSLAGAERRVIDLNELDITSVTAMAANDDHLVVVEIFFQPVRNRVHRIGYDGVIVETIELPPGFRLEDGLSGVRSGADRMIALEFRGGSAFGVWDPDGRVFEMMPTLVEGGVIVTPVPPDIEIGAVLITGDFTSGLGGLRYLGTAAGGDHVIERIDVLATHPAFDVLSTIEWYGADGALLGSARIPTLLEQHISTPPGVAMLPDGGVAVLLALENEVRIELLERTPGRITE